jgi:hypothetical protein
VRCYDENTSSQSQRGNLSATRTSCGHELEFGLPLFGAFPDQSLHVRPQVGDEQQYLQTLLAARTGHIQAQFHSQIPGIAKRLLDAHALRVQPYNRIGVQMLQSQAAHQQPRFTCATRTIGTAASLALGVVNVKLCLLFFGCLLYQERFRYQKAGVMLSDISPAGIHQGRTICPPTHHTHTDKLMPILEQINLKMRQDTLKLASDGIGQD